MLAPHLGQRHLPSSLSKEVPGGVSLRGSPVSGSYI